MRIEPVLVFNETVFDSSLVDSATVQKQIFQALYSLYNAGAALLSTLATLKQDNRSTIYQGSFQDQIQQLLEENTPPQTNRTFVSRGETFWAIFCSDKVLDDPGTVDDVREAYCETLVVTPFFAGIAAAEDTCLGWSIRGDDCFKGSFNQNTSHPILFVGNVADPVTPLARQVHIVLINVITAADGWFCSAFLMSEGFKGSVVLTQNSSGHTSPAAKSKCTSRILRAYFANGTLPEKGTVCQIESSIFGESHLSYIPGRNLRRRAIGSGFRTRCSHNRAEAQRIKVQTLSMSKT